MYRRFRGSLTNYRLALLVPALCEEETASGWLRVRRGPSGRGFEVRRGSVVAESSSDPREHLSQVLVDRGLLDMTEAVRAFEEARAARLPLGAYLAECEVVPPRVLREVLSDKAREGLQDCYGWESGEVEWLPGRVDSAAPLSFPLELPLKRLHLEAVEAWKQWRRFRAVFPEPSVRLEVSNTLSTAEAAERALLKRAAAGATVEQLVCKGGNKLATVRLLLRLLDEGKLAPAAMQATRFRRARELESMVGTARQLLEQGRYSQAAHVASRVLERGPFVQAERIYDEATRHLGSKAQVELEAIEERAYAAPLEGPVPEGLTSADLLLHAVLLRERSLRRALERTPVEPLNAYFAVKRLMAEGLIRLWPRARTEGSLRGVASANELPG